MARPTKCRRICTEPAYDQFLPGGIASGETIILTLDEYEAIRLIDLEKCTHAQCAEQMDISRTTVTELYETARYKIADSIVNGKPLQIAGAALFFAVFKALANIADSTFLSAFHWSKEIYNMMPFIASMVILIFTSKKSKAPKAEGVPYDKGSR